MKVFNKLVFICNIACIVTAILRLVEIQRKATGVNGHLTPLPPIEGIVAILGYGAIFINFIFVLTFIILSLRGKAILPKWITYFNVIMFPVQVWYFFFSKF